LGSCALFGGSAAVKEHIFELDQRPPTLLETFSAAAVHFFFFFFFFFFFSFLILNIIDWLICFSVCLVGCLIVCLFC
jgi:hypothetical protein